MTRRLSLVDVRIRALRNLREVAFEPAPLLNVLSGDNAQGKTSVLEALYLVATSRSFRTERSVEAIQEAEPLATVSVSVLEDGVARAQSVSLAAGQKSLRLDGKRVQAAAAFAVRTPVIVFHPGELALAGGGASLRRTLLDRLILYAEPAAMPSRERYARALRERQRALSLRGPSARELDAYEALLASEGARLGAARRRAAARLVEALGGAFERMAPAGLALLATYEPGGAEDEATLLRELRARRELDHRRGAATYGPQRDDLGLSLDGRSVRRHASQGQQRLVTLALKAAELACVREVRGVHPVLLLDDVSSELDSERTERALAFLTMTASQVFLTTTRPELFAGALERAGGRALWRLEAGRLSAG